MNAPRDPNRIPVVIGASTADNVTTLPLPIDPSTGYVCTLINAVPSMATLQYTGNMPRDKNRIPVMAGASTTNNTTLLPLLIDSVTGGVCIIV
jgi:hypothetical protein